MLGFITNLWFYTEAHEAAEYCSTVFPNSAITRIVRYAEADPGEPGSVMTVDIAALRLAADGSARR